MCGAGGRRNSHIRGSGREAGRRLAPRYCRPARKLWAPGPSVRRLAHLLSPAPPPPPPFRPPADYSMRDVERFHDEVAAVQRHLPADMGQWDGEGTGARACTRSGGAGLPPHGVLTQVCPFAAQTPCRLRHARRAGLPQRSDERHTDSVERRGPGCAPQRCCTPPRAAPAIAQAGSLRSGPPHPASLSLDLSHFLPSHGPTCRLQHARRGGLP